MQLAMEDALIRVRTQKALSPAPVTTVSYWQEMAVLATVGLRTYVHTHVTPRQTRNFSPLVYISINTLTL